MEIEKALWSMTVTEGETILVARYVYGEETDKRWSKKYETEGRYLITGRVQTYKNRPIIVDYQTMTALLGDDNTLVAVSCDTKELFEKENIKTLDELLARAEIKELFATKSTNVPSVFYQSVRGEGSQFDKKQSATEEQTAQIIEEIRAAMPIDSKVKLDVEFDNNSDPNIIAVAD